MALEGATPRPLRLTIPIVRRRLHTLRQTRRMPHLLLVTSRLLHEADRRREDAPSLLSRLDSARGERPAVTHALDMEENGDLGGACEQEVAAAGVGEEGRRDRLLRGGEGLRDDGAPVDAAGSWWMPWLAGVCKDVLGWGLVDV